MREKVKVTKIFTFEAAHALLAYDGDCQNIHGHSYQMHVTISGIPLKEPGHPKDGMVMDFKQLKLLVKEKVVKPYDHALILNELTPPEVIASLKKVYKKITLKPFQPTCENMLLESVHVIQKELPEGVGLAAIKLYETSTSYAEWVST